jgi:hypothetical protein
MRAKSSILAATLCFTLIVPMTTSAQSIESRPRRVYSAQEPNIRAAAYKPDGVIKSRAAGEVGANAAEAASLESLIPREGLQFYLEVRNGGVGELARAARALGPVTKLLGSGPMKVSASEFSSFVIGNIGALAGARIALVSYGANGAAALVEAANDSDAQQLKAGIAQMLGTGKAAAKAGQVDVDVRSRMVVAGSRPIVDMLTGAAGAAVIANDQDFMRASGRFSNDPFFAYMDIGSMPLLLPTTADAAGAAYAAGALAALNNRPYAIAMGGSFQGDVVTLRALMLYRANQSAGTFAGLFSSITSSARMGHPAAPSFAATDADLFVDVMIDWDKLYESVESIMSMMAGAQSGGGPQSSGAQRADLFAMAEASLGFSIKNELLPTLGNELAVSLSGFDRFLPSAARSAAYGQAARGTPRLQMPRFMLMVALKDPAGFERLISRLISKQGGSAAQLARATYRGATISYNKDVAYAISGGFFIISGSVADIRRSLDDHAAGSSLGSTAEFRAAVGSSQQAMMQVYLSSGVSNKIFEAISTEVVKANAELKDFVRSAAQTRSAIGLTITPDSDGLMMEMRAPTNMTFVALAAMATGKSSPYGITSAPAAGVGIPTPTTPAASIRNADGRRVPKMTNDDMTDRRP